nr:hypothetical protein [Prevotella sp.]
MSSAAQVHSLSLSSSFSACGFAGKTGKKCRRRNRHHRQQAVFHPHMSPPEWIHQPSSP